MNKLNHIPDELFNLLESKSWQSLDEIEKAIASKYISAIEYNSLHELFKETQQQFQKSQHIKAPEIIAMNLEAAFKKHHQKIITIPLWQVAAMFIIMFGISVYFYKNQKVIEKHIVSTIHDTLYVPQLAEAKQAITDTVVVYKYVYFPGSSNRKNLNDLALRLSNETLVKEVDIKVTQIRTLSPDAILSSSRNIKNKSMKEDTLYYKIGYASI